MGLDPALLLAQAITPREDNNLAGHTDVLRISSCVAVWIIIRFRDSYKTMFLVWQTTVLLLNGTPWLRLMLNV